MSLPAELHPAWQEPARPPAGRPPRRRTAPRKAPRVAPPAARPRRRHHVGFVIAAAILLGPMLIGIAGLNALLAQGSMRLEEAQRRIEALAIEHRELVHERAELSAPGRIATWARRNGMRLPDDIRPLHPFGGDQAAPAGVADLGGGGP